MSQLLEDAPFDVSKITLSKKESEATEAPSEPSLSSRPTSLTEDLDPADAVAELAKCRAEIKELQAQLCGLREQYEPASTSFTKAGEIYAIDCQPDHTFTILTNFRADGTFDKSDEIPAWVDKFCEPPPLHPPPPPFHSYPPSLPASSIEGMALSEDFKGDSYRSANKFKGLDYCHSPTSALKLSECVASEAKRHPNRALVLLAVFPERTPQRLPASAAASSGCRFDGFYGRGISPDNPPALCSRTLQP